MRLNCTARAASVLNDFFSSPPASSSFPLNLTLALPATGWDDLDYDALERPSIKTLGVLNNSQRRSHQIKVSMDFAREVARWALRAHKQIDKELQRDYSYVSRFDSKTWVE